MRPIDADELKKALNANCDTLCPDKNTNWCEHCCPHNDFEDLIDNAPTVEPCYQTTSCLEGIQPLFIYERYGYYTKGEQK